MNLMLSAQTDLPPALHWGTRLSAGAVTVLVAHVYREDGSSLCHQAPRLHQIAFTQPGRLCRYCERKLP